MVDCRSPIRSLVAVGLAFALVAAACGSSPSTSNPSGTAGSSPTGSGTAGSGNSLAPGLSAGLDKLDSYQFSWTLTPASSASSVPWVSGTVINKGTKSYRINDPGAVQFIVIGDKAWTSIDKGKTWATGDVPSVDLTNLMLDTGYATWFDKNAVSFKNAGEETKNDVPCVRYKGDSSLTGLYSSVSGALGQLTADLWIAKDGNYPVSGSFGYSATSAGSSAKSGNSGSFGFSFDVTHVNDSANSVAAPTNVLVEPTAAAST